MTCVEGLQRLFAQKAVIDSVNKHLDTEIAAGRLDGPLQLHLRPQNKSLYLFDQRLEDYVEGKEGMSDYKLWDMFEHSTLECLS